MNELTQWGQWVRADSDMLDSYSSWLLVMRGNVPIGKEKPLEITDDRALQIDTAVTRLASKSALLWQIICLKYINRLSLRDIAKALYAIDPGLNGGKLFSKDKINEKLNRAEGFIDGFLS